MKGIIKSLGMLLLIVGLILSLTACGEEIDEPEERFEEEDSASEEENDNAKEEWENQGKEGEKHMESKEADGNYFTTEIERSQELSNWIESKKYEAGEYQYSENKRIFLIAAGEKNTGGYSIKVLEEKLDGEDLTLVYKILAPGPDDIVTQAITYPHLLIKVTEEVENVDFMKNE